MTANAAFINAPCSKNQAFFDADDLTTEHLDGLAPTSAAYAAEVERISRAVDQTAAALANCQHCPLLKTCQRQTIKNIEEATPPAGVVQAGIFWGHNSKPDFTLNGCLTTKSANRLRKESVTAPRGTSTTAPKTVPIYKSLPSADIIDMETIEPSDGIIEARLTPWDCSWVPSVPEPINPSVVNIVLTAKDSSRGGVPLAKVHQNPEMEIGNREILRDSEVCEVLRQFHARGYTLHAMASKLMLSINHIKNLLHQLGIPYQVCEARRRAALLREANRREREALNATQTSAATALVEDSHRAWEQANEGVQLDLCVAAL